MWEREGGRDGNAIAPSRRSADDGHGLRDREKRKEKRERSDLGKVLCAIHVRPFSPSPLLKPLCCRRKDRSCQRGWLQIKNLVPLSSPRRLLLTFQFPPMGESPLAFREGGGGPGRAEEGIFPTEKRDRPLEPDYSEAARHA